MKSLNKLLNFLTEDNIQINEFKPYDKVKLENLLYDTNSKNLSFQIRKYHYKPKVERYIQHNYVKTAIYSKEPSISSKLVFNFDKNIDISLFCETQLFDLAIDMEFKKQICHYLSYKPQWLYYENLIEDLEEQISIKQKSKKVFNVQQYNFKKTDFKDTPSKLWLRIIFAPFTFGLSFINFLSKKQAQNNHELNLQNKQFNQLHKQEIDKLNAINKLEIDQYNASLQVQIINDQNKCEEYRNAQLNIEAQSDANGWIFLKDAFNFKYDKLKNKKGIYIIWNRTKNKYYVGQSKDLYKRIFTQHFAASAKDVKNIIFAKDWYDNDKFYFKYILIETKDELDSTEKNYIELYDSFRNGYNNTGGNN